MDWKISRNPALGRPACVLALLALLAGCAANPSQNSADESAQSDSAPGGATRTASGARAAKDKTQHADLWGRIRAGFRLPAIDSPHVAYFEEWYSRRPDYVENMVGRASRYLYYIVEEVEKRGMPSEIALLPAIESAYKPHAYSRAHAAGLWQFIPSTGRIYGLKQNWWYDGRRDVTEATAAALDYLEKLHTEFGDWYLALAAYNAGESRIRKEIANNHRRGLPTGYQALKLRPETMQYVPKLIAVKNIVTNPASYGLTLAAIPNQPYFARVEIGSQVDLGVVAKLTETPVDNLFDLNPGLKRWATDPTGPHHLLIPAEKKDALLSGLTDLPAQQRVLWSRHEVERSDTVGRIAQRYGVAVEALRIANNLTNDRISLGQNLLIPLSTRQIAGAKPVAPAPEKAKPATPKTVVAKAQPAGKVRVIHRVRAGDTLASIARKYDVYVHQLTSWNSLRADQVLQMGQRIQVWTY